MSITIDFVDYLHEKLQKDPELCLGFLNEARKSKDREHYLSSLNHVIMARGGYDLVAEKSGLSKKMLKDLLKGVKPLGKKELSLILESLGL